MCRHSREGENPAFLRRSGLPDQVGSDNEVGFTDGLLSKILNQRIPDKLEGYPHES